MNLELPATISLIGVSISLVGVFWLRKVGSIEDPIDRLHQGGWALAVCWFGIGITTASAIIQLAT